MADAHPRPTLRGPRAARVFGNLSQKRPNRCPISASRPFGEFFDRYADRRIVLLGEASHGTSNFYRARAAITRRLIEHHGILDRRGRGRLAGCRGDQPLYSSPPHRQGEAPFQRFPTWMWRNTDVAAFIDWMRSTTPLNRSNAGLDFYGLDIYNMAASIGAALQYLDKGRIQMRPL